MQFRYFCVQRDLHDEQHCTLAHRFLGFPIKFSIQSIPETVLQDYAFLNANGKDNLRTSLSGHDTWDETWLEYVIITLIQYLRSLEAFVRSTSNL